MSFRSFDSLTCFSLILFPGMGGISLASVLRMVSSPVRTKSLWHARTKMRPGGLYGGLTRGLPAVCPVFHTLMCSISCDIVDLDGKRRPQDFCPNSYSDAQKKRASLTYMFGRCAGCGNDRWRADDTTGQMRGNPSCSFVLSSYMLSLRRRKVTIIPQLGFLCGAEILWQVDSGDSSISSRAMTEVHAIFPSFITLTRRSSVFLVGYTTI